MTLLAKKMLPVDNEGVFADSWSFRFYWAQEVLTGSNCKMTELEVGRTIAEPLIATIMGYKPASNYNNICVFIDRLIRSPASPASHQLWWGTLPNSFVSQTVPRLRLALQTPEYLKFFGATTEEEIAQAWIDLHGSAGAPGRPEDCTDFKNILYLDRYLSPEPYKRDRYSYSRESASPYSYYDYEKIQTNAAQAIAESIDKENFAAYAASLQGAPKTAERVSKIEAMNKRLFTAVKDFTDEQLDYFRRTLNLALRLTTEIEDFTDEEVDVVVEYLQARRTREEEEVAVAPKRKPKIRILEPQYVVDLEPEEED